MGIDDDCVGCTGDVANVVYHDVVGITYTSNSVKVHVLLTLYRCHALPIA